LDRREPPFIRRFVVYYCSALYNVLGSDEVTAGFFVEDGKAFVRLRTRRGGGEALPIFDNVVRELTGASFQGTTSAGTIALADLTSLFAQIRELHFP